MFKCDEFNDSKSFKVINTFSPLTKGHAKSSAVVPVLKIDNMDKMCLSQALNRLRKIHQIITNFSKTNRRNYLNF